LLTSSASIWFGGIQNGFRRVTAEPVLLPPEAHGGYRFAAIIGGCGTDEGAAGMKLSATVPRKLSVLRDESRKGLDGSYKPRVQLYQSNKCDQATPYMPAL
jgi:hypothetical protein